VGFEGVLGSFWLEFGAGEVGGRVTGCRGAR